MACFHPMRGYRSPAGVTFKRSAGWTDLPPVTVACGQCIGCRMEHSRQWAVRIMHEAQMHEASCFITLTYDQVNLPADGSLDVRHWQLFIKRLRKNTNLKLRFYHCGEYGDDTGRPHYHAALFGTDFRSDRKHQNQSKGHALYRSPTLDQAWGLGHAWIGELTQQSANYVARYIMKKVTGDKAEDHYQYVQHTTGEVFSFKPEYSTMSRRPGIGSTWYDKFSSDVFPSDEVITNGKSFRPPAFYDKRLEVSDPAAFALIKTERARKGKLRSDNNTPDRLRTREQVKIKNSKHQERNPECSPP